MPSKLEQKCRERGAKEVSFQGHLEVFDEIIKREDVDHDEELQGFSFSSEDSEEKEEQQQESNQRI